MSNSLATLDWIVIAGYFLLLLGVAAWVILQKQNTSEDYFLAGRNMGWFVVGASIFASNIGSEHVVGLAGSGAGDKFPLLIYELHAWIVVLLGWVVLAILCAKWGLYNARIFRKAFQSKCPLVFVTL